MSEEKNENQSANVQDSKVTKSPDFTKLEEGQKTITGNLTNLNKRLDQLVSAVTAPAKQAPQDTENLGDLALTDPDKFVDRLTSKISEKVVADRQHVDNQNNEFNMSFSQLMEQFPELGNSKSKFYGRAKEILMEYTQGRPADAASLERAVLKTSIELGTLPTNSRPVPESDDMNDDDSFSGGGSSERGSSSQRRQKKGDLDPKTLEFARLLGRPVDDPKYVDKLKQIEKDRKGNWRQYK